MCCRPCKVVDSAIGRDNAPLPVIALVGRPNVGKSTLFNQLTRTRDALVADWPGLTRDRRYGLGRLGPRPYMVIDTGGIRGDEAGIDREMARQTRFAMEEADHVVLLMDGRDGLNAADRMVAERLRVLDKPMTLVVNKTDGLDTQTALAEYFELGLGAPMAIAAAHGRGLKPLMDRVLAGFPPAPETDADADEDTIRIAVVGRPNVGKSTLVNRLVGEERVVTFDLPGTTRDSIEVPFQRDGHAFVLIDTAGVRRRSKVRDAVEKFSVIKALQAIERAHVVIVVLDAREGVAEQDLTLLGLVLDAGRALVIGLNKWDGMERELREQTRRAVDLKLGFADFARLHFISARHGTGVGELMDSTRAAHRAAFADLPTPTLNEALEEAVAQHPPPLSKGRRIRLRYAHQGGKNPPRIIVHGNQVEAVPTAYERYLVNRFRKRFRLRGTPVVVEFKGHDNPYADRKNTLTERQIEKRKRLKKFVNRKAGR